MRGARLRDVPVPANVTVTVDRVGATPTARSLRSRAAAANDQQVATGTVRVMPTRPPPACPAGSERSPDGQSCLTPCPEGFIRAISAVHHWIGANGGEPSGPGRELHLFGREMDLESDDVTLEYQVPFVRDGAME